METHKDLKTLLDDALELRNVNHERLAELTGISERYLWAIQNLEVDKLPAAPYVRGYLKKISEVLHLNHDELWEMYKKAMEKKTAGRYDTLPANRFSIRHLSRRELFLLGAGALLILYLIINLPRLIGKPTLVVTNPTAPIFAFFEKTIILTGYSNQRDKLTVNGEEIFISKTGEFSKEYSLQPGLNKIEFKAKRFLGKEVSEIREIIYQPINGQR
ncbi:MAG: helix-turn-helix domain-containing protein [Candidatus Harrisonbacteria bacterium]|nr:helix-turn-helix domain-containing protein [Candidatus Harrisonbacteria bacterium]